MEDVAAEFGDTPGFFQLYTPTDRDLAASLVHRAEAAGFKGIVVTLDTWVTGWRPRDLSTSNFPQLRGHCLTNYTSDPVFRASLQRPARGEPAGRGAALDSGLRKPSDLGRPAVAALADQAAADREGHLPSRRRAARQGRRRRRHLLLQPRRPAGQRRPARAGLPAGRGRGRRRAAGAVRLGRSAAAPTSSRRWRWARPRWVSAAPTPTAWRSAASTASCTCCARCWPKPT